LFFCAFHFSRFRQRFLECAVRREVFVESKQQLVFGQPLSAILAREGGQLPSLGVKCVEFLSLHGMPAGAECLFVI
jgi:hypothetical protein